MNQNHRNLALWLVIILVGIALISIFQKPVPSASGIIFSDFIDNVEGGKINEVVIQGDNISGKYTDGSSFQTIVPPKDPDLIRTLRDKNIRIIVVPPEQQSWLTSLLISSFPMLLIIGIWIFFMRQMQGGGGKALSFGKSKARLLNDSKTRTTFKDVAGVEEAKEELQEIIELLTDPGKFQ